VAKVLQGIDFPACVDADNRVFQDLKIRFTSRELHDLHFNSFFNSLASVIIVLISIALKIKLIQNHEKHIQNNCKLVCAIDRISGHILRGT
jgi:hypothetical protein